MAIFQKMSSFSHKLSSVIIFFCLINQLPCNVAGDDDTNSITNMFSQIFGQLEIENFMGSYWKFSAFNELKMMNISNVCREQTTLFLDGIAKFESWSLKMLDASSKIPSGMLEGNLKDIGMYDECMSIKATKNSMTIQGRHCMYTLSLTIAKSNVAIEPTLSICAPAVCNVEDVNHLLQSAIGIAKGYINYSNISVKSVSCSNVDVESWETGAIVTMVILGLLIGFMMACTICDSLKQYNAFNKMNNPFFNALCKFSFYTNGKRILNTTAPRGSIPAIPGLRFFSMCWIILGHTYYNNLSGLLINRMDPLEWIKSWNSIYILAGHFVVDTFLVISGVLVSYIFLKTFTKSSKWNLISFYVYRWLRLTPALGMLLLMSIYLFPKLGSGPLWDAPMTSQSEYCSKNWWRMLLYVHNYGSSENLMCLGFTWYLAVDMQLFWISPLILIPIIYKRKVGFTFLGLLIIASIITPAYIAVTNKYSWSLLFKLDERVTADMMFYYYVPSYTRAGPYLLGILLGYLLISKTSPPSDNVLRLGWLLTVLAFIFSILSWRIFQLESYTYNMYWETFYNGFSQHIWALAICWIIYTAAIKRGGFIGSFLSLPFFLPFGEMSYCIYLIHFAVQTMKVNASRTPEYFSNFDMINVSISNFILTVVAAFFFSLIIETPFIVLKKILTEKVERKEVISNETLSSATSIEIDNDNVRQISCKV